MNNVTILAMQNPHYSRPTFVLVLLGLALCLTGCVRRTISITSQPVGALVHLNDEEIGRTPLQVPFAFYGTYDVRLEKEGFKPLWTKQKTDAPWWEAPGPDLFAEMVPGNKVEQEWHFELESTSVMSEDPLIGRAEELRASIGGGAKTAESD